MDDLTIVIRAEEEGIKEYVNVLEPLLMDYETELILVQNIANPLEISYPYTAYEYPSKEYKNFKEFCFASSLGKKVMIVEEGVKLTEEILDWIIKECRKEEYQSLECIARNYVSKDITKFFEKERTILYYRGIKGLSKSTSKIVEDFSLLSESPDKIERNIKKLLKNHLYEELYIWYENFILKLQDELQLQFYILLEREKAEVSEKDAKRIEEIFLKNPLENKYLHYLSLKKKYTESDFKVVGKELSKEKLKQEEVYYSWILKEGIKRKDHFIKLLQEYNEELQHLFLKYLFENDEEFNEQVYNFILLKNTEEKDDLILMEVYMSYMQKISESPIRKKKLLQIFELYTKYKLKFSDEKCKEASFIHDFLKGKALIDKNQIKEGISYLEKIAEIYKEQYKITRYYIQKTRYEKGCCTQTR